MEPHWGVDVSVNGETILTIESNCLSGKESFTPDEKRLIREAAAHLIAFVGEADTAWEFPADTQGGET